jgi:hypothetical protein
MKREGEGKEKLDVKVGRTACVPNSMASIDFTSRYGRHPVWFSCSVPLHGLQVLHSSHVLWPEFISLNELSLVSVLAEQI